MDGSLIGVARSAAAVALEAAVVDIDRAGTVAIVVLMGVRVDKAGDRYPSLAGGELDAELGIEDAHIAHVDRFPHFQQLPSPSSSSKGPAPRQPQSGGRAMAARCRQARTRQAVEQ